MLYPENYWSCISPLKSILKNFCVRIDIEHPKPSQDLTLLKIPHFKLL